MLRPSSFLVRPLRSLLSRGLLSRFIPFFSIPFGDDQEPAVGSPTQASGGYPGIVLKGTMNDTAVGRAFWWLPRDRPEGHDE